MGLKSSRHKSKSERPQVEDPLLDSEWREPSLRSYGVHRLEQSIVADIERIVPIGTPNLLISGPVGSGKSSFINAVFSIGENTKVTRALTGSSASSFTITYRAYHQQTLLKNFILRDTMGLEPFSGMGFHVDDFLYLVKGNIKNNYKFSPYTPISKDSPFFRKNPDPMDVIHCVIFVISAVVIYNDMPQSYISRIGELQEKLRYEGIPRILVLTKADQLCEKVKDDVSNMFRSRKIQKAVKIASEVFHIEPASIHPVVNYEVDYNLKPEKNIPLLLALRQGMVNADGYVKQTTDNSNIR